MAVEQADIEKIASLAKIRLDEQEIAPLRERLNNILNMVDTMQSVDTSDVLPMDNPHDAVQRLRPDCVSEQDQRETFQRIAPLAEDGLYLVPKVIE